MTIIVATARDGAIGNNGDLLWRLSPDMKRFKALTMGHPIIMGRRTWQSLPKGALPGRRNIVISRNPQFKAEGAEVYESLQQALKHTEGEEAFIIGGAQVYEQALPLADKLELTIVDKDYPEADTRLPILTELPGWVLTHSEPKATDEKSGLTYQFLKFENSNNK